MSGKYTYAQKRIVLIGSISLLDNKLITEKNAGNRTAIGIQIDVLREILHDLHDQRDEEKPHTEETR